MKPGGLSVGKITGFLFAFFGLVLLVELLGYNSFLALDGFLVYMYYICAVGSLVGGISMLFSSSGSLSSGPSPSEAIKDLK